MNMGNRSNHYYLLHGCINPTYALPSVLSIVYIDFVYYDTILYYNNYFILSFFSIFIFVFLSLDSSHLLVPKSSFGAYKYNLK